MKTSRLPSLATLGLIALTLPSCIVPPLPGHPGFPHPPFLPPPPPFGPPLLVLPAGARYTYYNGERCWHHNGHYYRHNPHGRGYVCFR